MLFKEDAQAAVKNERYLLEQKGCSSRDTDSGRNPDCTLERKEDGAYTGKGHKM